MTSPPESLSLPAALSRRAPGPPGGRPLSLHLAVVAQWANTMTFEGHSHYVMMVAFNPKDTNTL